MGRISYLMRREGRYYVQARLVPHVASIAGRALYRASLRTGDYRQARQRLVECMTWVHSMNDSIDHLSLFQKNVAQLRRYLGDEWPVTEERFVARRNYEELLKNMVRRARAGGFEPSMVTPDFHELHNQFVRQNVDAEAWLRKLENQRHYEQGRADTETRLGAAPRPASFASSHPGHTHQVPRARADFLADGPSAFPGDGAEMRSDEKTPWNLEVASAAADHSADAQASGKQALSVASLDESPGLPGAAMHMSDALAAYVESDIGLGGNADARSIVKLVAQFMIDILDDPTMHEFDAAMARTLDQMLPDIPDRPNIPRDHCISLATRYRYAQGHGWTGLKRLTEARLAAYHNALSRFFNWAIAAKLYSHAKPEFRTTSPENLVSIQRDSFKREELRTIFSQPLFSGCKSAGRIWVSGDCLYQGHLYWGYVLSFLTGLRAGELGRIELEDIEEDGGIYYLHLRGFNPAKGRVARKDVKRFKTQASHRTIPLHPLVLELGLLERIDDLRRIGCPVLFPEWDPYPKPGGEIRWGQPLTKSFQYLKKKAGLDRFDVTLYSTRHWFADLIDNTTLKHAARMRVMGHTSRNDMPARYGAKQRLGTQDLKQIVSASSPEIDDMAELLMDATRRAASGELTVIKPWLNTINWSHYYRETLLR